MSGVHSFDVRPDVQLGTYRHFKGDLYEAYDLVCDESTGEWRISYKPLYDVGPGMPEALSRTVANFFEEVSLGGLRLKRFERVTDEDARQ